VKILHLSSHYPPYGSGANERQCALMVRELARRNHVNRVLTSDCQSPQLPDREAAHVSRLLRLFTPADSGSFLRLLLIQRHNHRVLRAAIERLLPDLVLVWGLTGLSFSLLWELQNRRLATAYAVLDPWPRHGVRDDAWYRWWAAPLPLDQKILRRLLRQLRLDRPLQHAHSARRPSELRLESGFFVSRALRDSVRLAGFSVEGTEILPHGLAPDEFPAPSGRREEPRRLLWLGNLCAEQDPLTAIQALLELRHRGHTHFTLELVGRGDPHHEARVRDFVRTTQLAGSVSLRPLPPDDTSALHANYDIFLHTARQPDPFPLPLARALAARIPVVTTLEGSVADLVRREHNALIFRTGDPGDCASKIERLVLDRLLGTRLAEQAWHDALDHFSSATVCSRLDRLLHSLLHSHSTLSTDTLRQRNKDVR